MVGYGFARFRFPGRDLLFGICLATMMLPFIVTVIPRFVLFRNLGLFDTLWPLIIPWWFGGTPFAIFLFRQFYRGLPRELDEAAQMDGAGYFRTWWSVVLPSRWAIFAALAILHFVWFWNDFLGPLIYVNSNESTPLSTGHRPVRRRQQPPAMEPDDGGGARDDRSGRDRGAPRSATISSAASRSTGFGGR